ncbi:MAG: DUF917 domain-containing protein [Tateyamaria sp.]|jgi:DUF917 family protein|uniref:DUF917 domain-containing protein n=1 Tax=Tateyamaria sp. TaxID=1929288 RepID=UPI0032DE1AB8
MTRLNRQDLMDLLAGAAIFGTGGGGDLSEGIDLIDDALAQGKTFDLVALEDVPDDALICTPYMLGAISDLPADEEAGYARLPRIDVPPILLAYERFQQHLGRPFFGTVPCEMGGSNTAVAFYAAAMAGHKIIDADPAGRAVPEITHSTYFIAGLPAAPIVLANEFGEVMVLENIMDDMRAEAVVRALSVVSRNDIAAIDHAMPASQLRKALIPGTLSKALAMGRAHRLALEEGRDAVSVVAQVGGGEVAFRGEIVDCDWRTEGGFTLGSIDISGRGQQDASRYRISVKNENLVGWLDGAVHATVPDLICLFDTEMGQAVQNPHYHVGQQVAVVILPAPQAFLSPRGLAVFGPGYAGIDGHFRSPLSKRR